MKKRRLDRDRALRHELDLGVNATLNMGGGTMSRVASHKMNGRILFAFGDCVMGRGHIRQLQQTYSSSYRYLVKKLRSLGHKVVFYPERYTSQRFPITGTQMEDSGSDQV